ncbi:MAG: class I SAM-dependent methyltransferase [Myxococcales bacterium]|nr:class I SAM-dependent methyltransferase [Myxococcales bacterium]
MRADRPSFTAAIVSFARGVGVAGAAPDPFAAVVGHPLLRALLAARSAVGGVAPAAGEALRSVYRVMTLGMVDHATLRTLAVDRALLDGVRRGIDQLVILGAGLDTRAFRLDGLAGVDVFEVDHPASQRFKRARVAALSPACRSHRFIPVDFERASLDGALAAAGHDRSRPTLWLWESVAMYLTEGAVDATLDAVSARTVPGSRLVMTYMRTGSLPFGPLGARIIPPCFALGGEALRSTYDPAGIRALLERRGFAVRADENDDDWHPRYGGSPRLTRPFEGERLVVADAATSPVA